MKFIAGFDKPFEPLMLDDSNNNNDVQKVLTYFNSLVPDYTYIMHNNVINVYKDLCNSYLLLLVNYLNGNNKNLELKYSLINWNSPFDNVRTVKTNLNYNDIYAHITLLLTNFDFEQNVAILSDVGIVVGEDIKRRNSTMFNNLNYHGMDLSFERYKYKNIKKLVVDPNSEVMHVVVNNIFINCEEVVDEKNLLRKKDIIIKNYV